MYRVRNLRIRLSEWSGQDDRGSPARLGSEGMYILRKVRKLLPGESREIVGREYTVKELTKELMKDQMFYEESGGELHFPAERSCPWIWILSLLWRKS